MSYYRKKKNKMTIYLSELNLKFFKYKIVIHKTFNLLIVVSKLYCNQNNIFFCTRLKNFKNRFTQFRCVVIFTSLFFNFF